MTTAPIQLPPLDGFTRDELCELIRILHGGMVRAHADYVTLEGITQSAISSLRLHVLQGEPAA